MQQDRFVPILRLALLDLDAIYHQRGDFLGEQDAAEVMGIPSGKIHTWLGLGESRRNGRKSPLRPRLHHVAGIARLLILAGGDECTPDRWGEEMTRVCRVLWGKTPTPAGLLILRNMWTNKMPKSRVRGRPLDRTIFEGVATRPAAMRLAESLKMTDEERTDLLRSVEARDDAKRTAQIRRNKPLRSDDTGRELANKNRASEAEKRILRAYRELCEERPLTPSLTELATRAHADPRTVVPYVEKHDLALRAKWKRAKGAPPTNNMEA